VFRVTYLEYVVIVDAAVISMFNQCD